MQLVKRELLAQDEAGRCAEKDIFEFLNSLPTELEELHQRMLNKMGRNKTDIRGRIRMFQLVLFACHPLVTSELPHALAILGEYDAESTILDDFFFDIIFHLRVATSWRSNEVLAMPLTKPQDVTVSKLCIKQFARLFSALMVLLQLPILR